MVEDASGRRCPHRRSAKPSRPLGRGLSAIEALRRTILRTGVGWTSRARVRTPTRPHLEPSDEPLKILIPLRPPTFASQQPAQVEQPPVEISGASRTLGADKTQLRPASDRRRGYGPPMYSRSIESARSRVHLP
jgi:hypothetical protein